ncbi:MAG: PorT family protein [Saprospiraceae bacterium]|nr:PorT family protein [Saprospiraceae bacterium]
MKTVLKTTLIGALLFGCLNFAAAQVNFGFKAGLNLANVNFSEEFDDLVDPKMLITFQAGVIADINISEHIAIQPGLLLVGKGFKIDDDLSGKGSSNPMYLQVPVNVLYKGNMFYVGAGPYVGYGLYGKVKQDGFDDQDLNFGSEVDDDYAALDFGANIEAGVDLGMIRVGAGYALGLANIFPADFREGSDISAKHGVISVNVAYMFGGGDE